MTGGGTAQYRWCGGDVTFLGMHASEMVFGLGETDVARQLHVRWADGLESTLTDVAAGRIEVVHPGAAHASR